MKKFVAIVVLAVMMIGLFTLPSLAVNKADLLNEAAKSPLYKYVKVSVENASKTVVITDEQAEKLMPIVQKLVAALNEDNGSTFAKQGTGEQAYSQETEDFVFSCIDEACEIMNWTYTLTPVAHPTHEGDVIFTVYEGKTPIFVYEGDVVADTSAAPVYSYGLLAAAAVLLLAGAASVVVTRKSLAR